MVKIKRTVTLDGTLDSDYQAILHYFEVNNPTEHGWDIYKEPLIKRVTVIKSEEVSKL